LIVYTSLVLNYYVRIFKVTKYKFKDFQGPELFSKSFQVMKIKYKLDVSQQQTINQYGSTGNSYVTLTFEAMILKPNQLVTEL